MDANIGITSEHTKEIVKILHTLLADETILYTKTRNYHWNIESPHFMSMHLFYEEQYNDLATFIDEVAERIRQLGHMAKGRLQDYLALTTLQESESKEEQQIQVKNLLEDHEALCRSIRKVIPTIEEEYQDVGTADFLTAALQMHEKMAWMLRAHLK